MRSKGIREAKNGGTNAKLYAHLTWRGVRGFGCVAVSAHLQRPMCAHCMDASHDAWTHVACCLSRTAHHVFVAARTTTRSRGKARDLRTMKVTSYVSASALELSSVPAAGADLEQRL